MGEGAGYRRFSHLSARRVILIAAAALACIVAAAASILAVKWPFSRDAVIARLSKDTGANVSVGGFQTTYFPPGLKARKLVLTDRQNGAAILTAEDFRVRANWIGLLHEHLSSMEIDGFQVKAGNTHLSPQPESTDVSTLIARNGSVEFASSDPAADSFGVTVRQLIIHGAGGPHPKFELNAAPVQPPGDFHASGQLDSKGNNISAQYTFSNADLGVFGGVHGTFASSGKITGSLARLEWNGTADIPNFLVDGSTHRVHLEAAYTVFVNTADASFDLQKIQASFNQTTVSAHGRIAAEQPQSARTLRLTAVTQGRIEDLLNLVSSDARPSMTGDVRFNADLVYPPSNAGFLHRLKVDAAFEIDRALFSSPATQSPLDYLSESAHDASRAEERRDPNRIPATITGDIHDANAIAHLENVRYSMPGVSANLGGTFNLVSKAVRLDGVLTTTGELPDATTAVKAAILMVARPLFGIHKKGKTTIAGFTITGTSKHPSLSLSSSRLLRDAEHFATR